MEPEPDPGTESPDDFGEAPSDEPWGWEEEPGVVPEPTQVFPGEPDGPGEPDDFGGPDEPMYADADVPEPFVG